jgi:glycosyltransferase involved in cell wall biosynthesis
MPRLNSRLIRVARRIASITRRGLAATRFNKNDYLLLNPEVQEAGISPLKHFVLHGFSEGRAFRLEQPEVLVGGRKKNDAPSVLLVSHDASRTGAPVLALNIARELSADKNVVVLLLGGGELKNEFRETSCELICAPNGRGNPSVSRWLIEKICTEHVIDYALVNSVASWSVLQALSTREIATVHLIHEFASETPSAESFLKSLMWSTHTVFSTRLTLDSALKDDLRFDPTAMTSVMAQGRSSSLSHSESDETLEPERMRLKRLMRPEGEGSDVFVVLGAGVICYRKGVDLFIECANRVINTHGNRKIRFVWAGELLDFPQYVEYKNFLDDQIKRSGLSLHVTFAGKLNDIELAYQLADLLVVSSRLDPLPNVSIDMLNAGKPVMCFDRAAGTADVLIENGMKDQLVADYLDTSDMAAKINAIASSSELYADLCRNSKALAITAFDMKDYVKRLEAIGRDAAVRISQEKLDIETIFNSGLFEHEFSVPAAEAALPEKIQIRNYVRSWRTGYFTRKPRRGFHPGIYAELNGLYTEVNGIRTLDRDPFAHYLSAGRPDGLWQAPVIIGALSNGDGGSSISSDSRVALHIHAYYPEMLSSLLDRLAVNKVSADLFISVKNDQAKSLVADICLKHGLSNVDIRAVPNRGRDIGPLLITFGKHLVDNYEIIGHVHTKSSPHVQNRSFANAWTEFLFENLLGGEKGGAMADRIVAAMHQDPRVALVFPDDPHVVGWTLNRDYAESIASKLDISQLPKQFDFPIGTMFWIRSDALTRFVACNLDWDDFPAEPVPIDGTKLHALERLFGLVGMMDSSAVIAKSSVEGVSR